MVLQSKHKNFPNEKGKSNNFHFIFIKIVSSSHPAKDNYIFLKQTCYFLNEKKVKFIYSQCLGS